MTKSVTHETCARCDGQGWYWRVPDGFNPFLAGGFTTAKAMYKVDCCRPVPYPSPIEGEVGSPNVTNHGSKSDLHPEYVTSEAGTKSGYKSDLHPGNVPAEDDA